MISLKLRKMPNFPPLIIDAKEEEFQYHYLQAKMRARLWVSRQKRQISCQRSFRMTFDSFGKEYRSFVVLGVSLEHCFEEMFYFGLKPV